MARQSYLYTETLTPNIFPPEINFILIHPVTLAVVADLISKYVAEVVKEENTYPIHWAMGLISKIEKSLKGLIRSSVEREKEREREERKKTSGGGVGGQSPSRIYFCIVDSRIHSERRIIYIIYVQD